MTPSELQTRLKSISESNRTVSQLNAKLYKLAPSSGPDGSTDTTEDRVELSNEIHQTLKELEEDFELLKQGAEDLTSTGGNTRRRDVEKDTQRIALATQVERLGEDLKLSRAQFRRAQLSAKRAEEAFRRSDREQLFAGLQDGQRGPGKRRNTEKLSQDDLVLGASSDVTAALRRTHQLMSSELEKSHFAHETLRNSTAVLNTLNESYSTLESLLSSSKSLIGTLVSSQKSDTWYLETALYILLVTVGWLSFRRLFYGPIRYLLYLPTKWVLNLFITLGQIAVGIVGGTASASGTALSSSRTPLKVQPSASNRPPPMQEPASMIVGAGGAKGKKSRLPTPEIETLSNTVGQMAEETQAAERGGAKDEGNKYGEASEQGGGGDKGKSSEEKGTEEQGGTKLRPRRPDEKPNPKKRMFEDPPSEQKARDEL